MVTNSLTFVDKVDIIVVLDKGCISEYGTFTELLQRQGPFTEFLHEHLRKKMENDDSDDSADGENGDEEVKCKCALFNSVTVGKYGDMAKISRFFIYDSVIDTSSILYPIVVTWMPNYLSEVMLIMVWVMAWCRQTTNCYLIQFWPRSITMTS